MADAKDVQLSTGDGERDAQTMNRREFMRRAAQVGGLTVFGLLGAEAIIPAVIARLRTLDGNRNLAHQIADGLERSGLVSRGEASEVCIPVPNVFECRPTGNYDCSSEQTDHVCGLFNCTNDFDCQASDDFECGGFSPGFICRAPASDFHCSASSSFACLVPVICKPTTGDYICPSGTSYSC